MARAGTIALAALLLGSGAAPALYYATAGQLRNEDAPALWHQPPAVAQAPTQIRVRAIGVEAPLVELRLDNAGALESPQDYDLPGWYAQGTPPGDIGPAVIAGHVDSQDGPAVFYRLRDLRPGDLIEVRRGGRWIAFEVVASGRYAKDHFPTAQVYGPTPDAQLRLITCGGVFDRSQRSYRDNLVVFAIIKGDV